MFGPFLSVEKKTRKTAKYWLETAVRVYHYRRDVLDETELGNLSRATELLRQRMREKADVGKLKLAIEGLAEVLEKVGGTHYPKTTLVDWTEFLLVAAIVILGIRTYFVQPFKIPTNSMWPSYNGMTPEVFHSKEEEPNVAMRGMRFLTMLASPYRIDAKDDGEVLIPIRSDAQGAVPFEAKTGRSWLVFPEPMKEFYLLAGERWVSVTVPKDFDFGWVLRDAFFPGENLFRDVLSEKLRSRELIRKPTRMPNGERVDLFLKTGKFVKRGERVVSFDILTGDQLFVDRMTYHFVRPKVGEGFVFRTDNIRSRHMQTEDGRQVVSYYIKRLTGVPRDELEIKPPLLLRNGKPIEGARAFEWNHKLERGFGGYVNGYEDSRYPEMLLAPGQKIKVPQDCFVALGDNSRNSLDSRYWGFVKSESVVGRPLFIYYPFTKHWGVAP